MTDSTNLFADAKDVEALIFQLVGAASSCWSDLDNAGTFNAELAERIGRDGVQRLSQLIGEPQ